MLTVRDKNFLKKDCGSENLSISSYKDFGNLSADRTKAFVNFSNVEVQDDRVFFVLSGGIFHVHSRFIRQQGKGEAIHLAPPYHFHPLHRHLDISLAIAAESSPLHVASSWTRTRNLWFPSASR